MAVIPENLPLNDWLLLDLTRQIYPESRIKRTAQALVEIIDRRPFRVKSLVF